MTLDCDPSAIYGQCPRCNYTGMIYGTAAVDYSYWYRTATYDTSSYSGVWLVPKPEMQGLTASLIRGMFFKFINGFLPPDLEPNPLPILARAINAIGLRFPIHQPRWKAGRWKSKT
jgi:hypothetical protein